MSLEAILAAARERPDDEGALSNLARTALAEGSEDAALPLLRAAAERGGSSRLWQWRGLLERSIDEHEQALASFEKAAALAPSDRSIAHGRARVALEAGVPAGGLFETALRVSPGDPDVLLGYASSQFADGDTAGAKSTLGHALARSPLWIDGHMQLAQLRSIIGEKDRATDLIESAIEAHPDQEQLWIALFRVLLQSQQFFALDEAIARAKSSSLPQKTLLQYEAIAAVEIGDTSRADRIFAAMTPDLCRSAAIWSIRHLLRSGRVAEACASIDAALKTDLAPDVWPYAAVAWRLAGDPRWEWLEGDPNRLTSVFDLTSELPDMPALERVLRKLHAGMGEFLDQSVRGGSQTNGPLFTKINPEIRTLRAAVVGAVERHIENLPSPDPGHPLLGRPRDRKIRFSGSWSVLLRGGGYHANHVHPQGWISSALYIHLPEPGADDLTTAGWLTLGEPQAELGIELDASREIEPKVGRLVLFPSYMWHGTRPFAQGERLTVAFDVRLPI